MFQKRVCFFFFLKKWHFTFPSASRFVIKYIPIPSVEMLTLSSALRGTGILLRENFLGSGGGSLLDNARGFGHSGNRRSEITW